MIDVVCRMQLDETHKAATRANGECRFVDCHSLDRSIVVSSERLNDNKSDWERVAPNHVLTVSSQIELRVNLIEIERPSSSVAARSSSLN